MNESRIELPAWLPWATTACLAALVACLGERWAIEKARSELLREEGMLTEAALKGMQNQLEAERIVNRSEIAGLRAASGRPAALHAALLLAPAGSPARPPTPPFGVVAWDPEGRRALAMFNGLPAQAPDRDYQLWLEGPGPGNPADCGVFHAPADNGGSGILIKINGSMGPGCRFLLVDGAKGGARTLGEAEAGGPIVLATLPLGEKILNR